MSVIFVSDLPPAVRSRMLEPGADSAHRDLFATGGMTAVFEEALRDDLGAGDREAWRLVRQRLLSGYGLASATVATYLSRVRAEPGLPYPDARQSGGHRRYFVAALHDIAEALAGDWVRRHQGQAPSEADADHLPC